MKSIYLLISFSLFNLKVNSQIFDRPIYTSGKIITKTDTINCFLESRDCYSGLIRYKLSKDDLKVLKVNESEVEHINIPPKNFDRIIIDKKNSCLMEKLCEGEVSFYKYTYIIKSYGSNGLPLNSSSEAENYYVVKGSEVFVIKKKDFKERLKKIMTDYEEIYNKIDQLNFRDILFYSDLKGIISRYNFRLKFK
jgi:hypothetical protein